MNSINEIKYRNTKFKLLIYVFIWILLCVCGYLSKLYLSTFVWYSWEPVYPYLHLLKENLAAIMLGIFALGIFAILWHDYRQMKNLVTKEREAALKLAAQSEQRKNDLVVYLAHDLKTPLTSIIGYADMLNSLKLSEEECHDAYFYIYSQGKRLESLSHKLLELVSMDKNPIIFRPIPTKELEQNLRITMRPVWKQRGVRGKVEMEKAVIQGDAELLLSLLYNLMDNAVKAMDKGDESFMLMKGTCLKDFYEIKVVDNGRGIPEEEISRITEAFYMVDKSRSRKEGGAGIGMALCQKIIQLHNGTMVVQSRLGEGTVIKITFPRG